MAFAKVPTDTAGDFPSISNQDEYMGFLRFDEVRLIIFGFKARTKLASS